MTGWHLDVGDYHVRPVYAGHLDEIDRVVRRAHYLESALGENADDSLSDEGLILADYDADRPRCAHAPNARRPAPAAVAARLLSAVLVLAAPGRDPRAGRRADHEQPGYNRPARQEAAS